MATQLPYPPGNVLVNGQSYPTSVLGDAVMTWADRNRTPQGSVAIPQTQASVPGGIEGNYTIAILIDGVLIRTLTGQTGNSFTYTMVQRVTDNADTTKLTSIRIAVNGALSARRTITLLMVQLTVATPTFSPVAGSYTAFECHDLGSRRGCDLLHHGRIDANHRFNPVHRAGVSRCDGNTQSDRRQSGVSEFRHRQRGIHHHVPPTQPTPTFSPVAGTYTGTQSVTITSASADAIYYTTDGSTPTIGSTLYTGPVSVATSHTVKALAVRAGYINSAIGSAAYVISAPAPTPTVVRVSSATFNAALADSAVTLGAAAAAGNCLLVMVHQQGTSTSVTSVTDDVGNTYTLVSGPDAHTDTVGPIRRYLYICQTITGAPTIVTVHKGAGAFTQIAVVEIAGQRPWLRRGSTAWQAAQQAGRARRLRRHPRTTCSCLL